jgi:hypothetical protein
MLHPFLAATLLTGQTGRLLSADAQAVDRSQRADALRQAGMGESLRNLKM